jgi:hypothetical protein
MSGIADKLAIFAAGPKANSPQARDKLTSGQKRGGKLKNARHRLWRSLCLDSKGKLISVCHFSLQGNVQPKGIRNPSIICDFKCHLPALISSNAGRWIL